MAKFLPSLYNGDGSVRDFCNGRMILWRYQELWQKRYDTALEMWENEPPEVIVWIACLKDVLNKDQMGRFKSFCGGEPETMANRVVEKMFSTRKDSNPLLARSGEKDKDIESIRKAWETCVSVWGRQAAWLRQNTKPDLGYTRADAPKEFPTAIRVRAGKRIWMGGLAKIISDERDRAEKELADKGPPELKCAACEGVGSSPMGDECWSCKGEGILKRRPIQSEQAYA